MALSTVGTVYAVSCDTGSGLWEVKGEVAGKEICPFSLLFSQQHHVLLVADRYSYRILVLNPGDGSLLQSIQLPPEVGEPFNMWWYRDQLVLRSYKDGYHFSFFSVQ